MFGRAVAPRRLYFRILIGLRRILGNDQFLLAGLALVIGIAAAGGAIAFREALAAFIDLARAGNKYLADTEPWKVIKNDEQRVGTILNISIQVVANLAVLGAPFLPFTSEKILSMLNVVSFKWSQAGKIDLIQENHILEKPGLLFEKSMKVDIH